MMEVRYHLKSPPDLRTPGANEYTEKEKVRRAKLKIKMEKLERPN